MLHVAHRPSLLLISDVLAQARARAVDVVAANRARAVAAAAAVAVAVAAVADVVAVSNRKVPSGEAASLEAPEAVLRSHER